jgi:transcription antitermination factor NusG
MWRGSVKIWLGVVAVVVCQAACYAQASPALKSVIGEVTSIDAASKEVKLKGDDGAAYTITLSDTTSFLRIPPGEKDIKKASKIAFADVTVGDRALARGPIEDGAKTVPARTLIIMTKGDLAQKRQHDQAEWQTRGVTGTVSALNAANKEVTITTRGREPKTIVIDASAADYRRYAPDSTKFVDAKPSSFADLQPGDTVRALGDKNEDGTHLKAEEVVSGAFETIAGTVDSVDPATGEVHITNLQTKKPVVVRTNQNTQLRRLDPQMAAVLARRLRPAAASEGGQAPAGAPTAGGRPEGAQQGPPGGAGGFRGGPGGGGGDLQQILDRMPALSLSELKKGDAVIVSSSKNPGDSAISAFSFVAGVEPFLAAAPRSGGQVNLGSWNLDVGGGADQ